MTPLLYVITGLAAGVCSGLFGIGGGVIIVPMLMFLAGASQHKAVGTSLVALLLPVGIMAVWEYYKSGKIDNQDIVFGLLIALGLFIGAFAGSKLGLSMSEANLRRAFAVFVIVVGVRLLVKA